MTLDEILTYANVLTEDAFEDLSDIIDWLNEAQDIIARWDKIQATPVEYELTSNEITLPEDFMQLAKCTLDDVAYVPPSEPWAGDLTLHTELTEGTLKLWYYKFPEPLLAATPTQVPEVKSQYHRSMASYAAKMNFLKDDDPELREAFRVEFAQQLGAMKVSTGLTTQYYNL